MQKLFEEVREIYTPQGTREYTSLTTWKQKAIAKGYYVVDDEAPIYYAYSTKQGALDPTLGLEVGSFDDEELHSGYLMESEETMNYDDFNTWVLDAQLLHYYTNQDKAGNRDAFNAYTHDHMGSFNMDKHKGYLVVR